MNIVEFAGMPKAGKSTQIELLETYLKHERGLKIRIVYEGARICPLEKTDRFLFNSWSFNNTINRVMEVKNQSFDFVLIDRGVQDHICFTKALYDAGQITFQQYEAQLGYFEQFLFLEDEVLIFLIDPEESMRREYKHQSFDGRVMNNNFLSLLYAEYKKTKAENQKFTAIDCNKPVIVNKEEILNFIL